MKILLVAGGKLPIPPPAWGGVENVVWQQYEFLTRAGHDVTIFNQPGRIWHAVVAKPWQYDLVHLHDDGRAHLWAPLAKWFGFRLALTTHNGYTAFPAHWHKKYPRTWAHVLRVPNQITLSHEIRDFLFERGYTGKAWVLPNGIETAAVRFDPAPQAAKALVLGRIQPRKKQRFLADILAAHPDITLDLVGPTDEPDFHGNGANVRTLGAWNREQVRQNLTDYAAMVLISDGEAHAGVLLEAMAAGLSLVVSPEAAHNLDTAKPFVYVVNRDQPEDIVAALRRAIHENAGHRAAIRAYCEQTFDWRVIGARYERILNAIVRGESEPFAYAPGK